jgi:hypothetical protein
MTTWFLAIGLIARSQAGYNKIKIYQEDSWLEEKLEKSNKW